jgi:hypothetical protein
MLPRPKRFALVKYSHLASDTAKTFGYKQRFFSQRKSSVIPAGMPESRAMDGNYIWHLCPI